MMRPAPASPVPVTGVPERIASLDALRVAVVAMVVVHHAAQAYGPTGSVWPVEDEATSDWFLPFFTVNAAVGLGLLFLLAGWFVPRSFDRKGPRRFLKERWARIGIPVVVIGLGLHLPLVYLYEERPPLGTFLGDLYEDGWQAIYLHLWFLGQLLLYSAVYVAWRRYAPPGGTARRLRRPPTNAAILGFVVALALATWVVRWWFPVDEWVPLLFVLTAEPANLIQYVSLFTLGIVASRNDWFRRLPTATGMVWLGIGVAAAAAVYALGSTELWSSGRATGGRTWEALLRTTLESLICAGLSVGLVVAFRELVTRSGRLLGAMAAASFAAYIVHLYIVVGLQVAILGVPLPAFAKFAVVAVLGVTLTFGAAHLSRRVPGVRVVLGTAPSRPDATTPARPATARSA
jgi:peptidoglycan/LPS O-acetylase OafA/YrhL